MTSFDCLACEMAGTTPQKGEGVVLTINPRYQRHGVVSVDGGGEYLLDRVLIDGVEETIADYPPVTREAVLVFCWWAGLHGSRRFRKVWGEWAQKADEHLWYGCINIPDPPKEGKKP